MPAADNRSGARNAGFALVELVVAMIIAAIVTSLALASWAFISAHTSRGKRLSQFRAQAEQTAFFVVDGVRRSDRVLSFDKTSITYLSARGDTATISFDNDSLRKNRVPVGLVPQGSSVTKFSIEKDDASANDTDVTLLITLGLQDAQGTKSEIPSVVKIRFEPDAGGVAFP